MNALPRFTAASSLELVGTVRAAPPPPVPPLPLLPWPPLGPSVCLGGCPPDTQCARDIAFLQGFPFGMCCPIGTIACGGICRQRCPAPKYMDRVNCACLCPDTIPPTCFPPFAQNAQTCVCECDPSTPCPDPNQTRDPATCVCRCDPTLTCPILGQTRDPITCVCSCPPGKIPCQGLCIDPLTDQTFCGGCPGDTCNPYNQKCCGGVCTTLCTDANCRDCGEKMPAGFGCCLVGPGAMNCGPVKLGNKAHCASCTDVCSGGMDCISGKCDCPAGRARCGPVGNEFCCSPNRSCCDNQCVDLQTNPDHCGSCPNKCATGETCCSGTCANLQTSTDHCGSCPNKCSPGRVCSNGTCVCAPPTTPCGPGCCPAGWGCSADTTLCCLGAPPGGISCPGWPGGPFNGGPYCCRPGSRCCTTNPGGCC
jgi:hypothetical protein